MLSHKSQRSLKEFFCPVGLLGEKIPLGWGGMPGGLTGRAGLADWESRLLGLARLAGCLAWVSWPHLVGLPELGWPGILHAS